MTYPRSLSKGKTEPGLEQGLLAQPVYIPPALAASYTWLCPFGGGGKVCLFVCLFWSFVFFRAARTAYGGSQARGRIGAAAAGLHHSHSNGGYELHL